MASNFTLSRVILLATLPLLSFLGYYSVWSGSNVNGTLGHVARVLIQGREAKFPGTDFPITRHYTGIAAVDKQLVVLVTFFAPVVDGNIGSFAAWGMGQFGAAWCLMLLESLRAGNKGRLVAWVGTFGIVTQLITFTVTAPLWLFLHLLTSPVAASSPSPSSVLVSALDLNVIPLNICLSYIFPTILMGFPSPKQTSPSLHQLLIVLWQPFPLWSVLIQYILPITIQFRPEDTTQRKSGGSAYLQNSKSVYTFALFLCTATHLTSLYSSISNRGFTEAFIPFSLTNPGQQVPNLAVGVKNFLQWDVYIGVTAFLIWSLYLYLNARSSVKDVTESMGSNLIFAVRTAVWAALAGPMGVVLVLLGARDETLLHERLEGGKKKD